MSSAVVLLSSGLDSTVNLFLTHREHKIKAVLTFDYGQRAAVREIEKSRAQCLRLGLRHEVIELPWLQKITQTSLVNRDKTVPVGNDISMDNQLKSERSAQAVWVPNRNGAFLNIAAAFAESLEAEFVVPGFNAEEAVTFADNSVEYLHALDHSFSFSTRSKVKTKCYTQHLDKTQIVALGLKLANEMGLDFDLMWPCYFSGETLCGQCESCQRFYRAVQMAKIFKGNIHSANAIS